MIIVGDALVLDQLTDIALLLPHDLHSHLRLVLKRCERLGHKSRDADRHLRRLTLIAVFAAHFIAHLEHLVSQLSNTGQVLFGLRRQSHHEIQLELAPAIAERPSGHFQEILFGDALVDHIPKPLGASLWGKGQTGPSDLLHRFRQAHGEIVHPQ